MWEKTFRSIDENRKQREKVSSKKMWLKKLGIQFKLFPLFHCLACSNPDHQFPLSLICSLCVLPHFCAVLCLLKIQLFLNAAPLNARKFLNRTRTKLELLQQVYGCWKFPLFQGFSGETSLSLLWAQPIASESCEVIRVSVGNHCLIRLINERKSQKIGRQRS